MDHLLQDQINYYQDRAFEYDEWFYRQGRYDRGEEFNRAWFQETAILGQKLAALKPVRSALEVACGTGIWTQALAAQCDHLTALDAAEAMLEANRQKNKSILSKIRFVEADFYHWNTGESFDLVFSSFFISHVPREKLAFIAGKLRSLCAPRGELLLFDSLPDQSSTAVNHNFRTDGIQERKLNDGRSYQVIKIFYRKEEILEAFSGFREVEYGVTGKYFWYLKCR